MSPFEASPSAAASSPESSKVKPTNAVKNIYKKKQYQCSRNCKKGISYLTITKPQYVLTWVEIFNECGNFSCKIKPSEGGDRLRRETEQTEISDLI